MNDIPKPPVRNNFKTLGEYNAALRSYKLNVHKYNLNNNPERLANESEEQYSNRSKYFDYKVRQEEDKYPASKAYLEMKDDQNSDTNPITRTLRSVLTSPVHVAYGIYNSANPHDTNKFKSKAVKNNEELDLLNSALDVRSLMNPFDYGIKAKPLLQQVTKRVAKETLEDKAFDGAKKTNEYINNEFADGGQLHNEINPKYNNYLNMNRYSQGGNLTRFDAGGTHESNPLGGIPQGQAPDGSMNSVEQGESKKGNFIYSNRIALDKDLVKQFNLPGYVANKSVSAASKAIDDKFKDRQDKYAQETKNTLLDRLSQAQEFLKEQEANEAEQANQSMQANSQQVPDMMNGEVPQGMEEYVEQPVEEGAVEGQALNPASPVAAFGGYQMKRYFDGGPMGANLTPAGLVPMQGATLSAPAVPASAGINPMASKATPGAPGAGSVMQAAGTALELGKLAFGKSAQDTSGEAESANVDRAGMAIGSTMKGAQAGTAIMPGIGTAVGAVIGLGAGLLGGAKQKRDAIENTNRFAYKQNSKLSDNYAAYGGPLDISSEVDPTKKAPQMEVQTAQLPIKKINYNVETTGVKEGNLPPGYYTRVDYNNGKSDYLRPEGLSELQRMNNYRLYMESQAANQRKFLLGGDTQEDPYGPKPFSKTEAPWYMKQILPSNTVKSFTNNFGEDSSTLPAYKPQFTDYKYGDNNVDGIVDKNDIFAKSNINSKNKNSSAIIGEALRYAPVAMNAYQLAKLQKPGGVNYQTLDNRYKPSYVDEAQMQRTVDQEANNQLAAIGQSGASQGAMRSSILAAGLNKTKALSDAYANAAAQNRATDDRAQEFNRNTDLQNMANRNKAIDEERMDEAAYRGAKSKLLSTIGTDIGHIGKEIADAKLARNLTGYTRVGDYVMRPDGTKADAMETVSYNNFIANKNKSAYGGYLRINKKRK